MSLAARTAAMLRDPPRVVAAMLVVATLLAFAMAFTEGINPRPEAWQGPPDEHNHRSAARYYVDHWLPPKVGDPASLDSYSRDYGYSYINDPDLVYFFAGKFTALVSPLLPDRERGFRLFNVTLLGLLALLCLRRPAAWPIFVPLLLTPQVWYIFSYFNGDAFALFVAMLLAYQIAAPQSAFNAYLDAPGVVRKLGGALLFGALAGVLALGKQNYLAFLAMVPVAIMLARLGVAAAALTGIAALVSAAIYLRYWPIAQEDALRLGVVASAAILAAMLGPRATRKARAVTLAKMAVIGIGLAAVVASRFAWDVATHGSMLQKQVDQYLLQEQIAKPEYKPSQIFQGKDKAATYYGLDLRKRGTTLAELFGPHWSWHTKTFTTSTGSYGWLTINSPRPYAVLILAAYLAVFGLYAWASLRSREPPVVGNLLMVCAFSALTVFVAVHHSWNNDFQAQGRYLFPIVAMLGIGLMGARRWLPVAPLTGFMSAAFALSVYSFVFIGLWHVQRSF